MGSLAQMEGMEGEARMTPVWMGSEALQDPSLPTVFPGVSRPVLMILVSRTFLELHFPAGSDPL